MPESGNRKKQFFFFFGKLEAGCVFLFFGKVRVESVFGKQQMEIVSFFHFGKHMSRAIRAGFLFFFGNFFDKGRENKNSSCL